MQKNCYSSVNLLTKIAEEHEAVNSNH